MIELSWFGAIARKFVELEKVLARESRATIAAIEEAIASTGYKVLGHKVLPKEG